MAANEWFGQAFASRAELEARGRAGQWASYVGGVCLCKVLDRHLLYVPAGDCQVGARLMADGYWEAWVTLALGRLVRPGCQCIDVGAHAGYYACLMGDLAGPRGRVTALEPNPRLHPLLLRSLRANGLAGRVRALPLAAGGAKGPALLRVPRLARGCGSICVRPDGDMVTSYACDRVRLDDVVTPPVDLVKIDAEGADYDVLEGMAGLLEASPGCVVFLEHCEALFYPGRAGEQLGRALALGLSLSHVAYDGKVVPITRRDVLAEPDRLWNLVLRR